MLSRHQPGGTIRYSEIIPVQQALGISAGRTAEVLQEMGVLDDDRRPSFESWLERKLDGLAPGIRADAETWLRTLRGRSRRPRRFPPGDTLVVWRLDRLGRSLRHLVETVNALADRRVAFASLHEGIDTTTSTGRLVFHIFAALAEFERELIAERAAVGRTAARARGRLGGRPAKLSPEQTRLARARYKAQDVTVAEIARALGVGRGTIYRALQQTP